MNEQQKCHRVDPASEEFARRMYAGTLHNIANVLTTTRLAVSDLEEAHSAENTEIVDAILNEFLPPLEDAVRDGEAPTFLAADGPGSEYLASIRQLLEHQRRALTTQHESVESIRRKLLHISEIIVLQQRLLNGTAGPESVSVDEAAEAALGMMDEIVRQQRVEVVREFGAGYPARADRAVLTQVLINIIKNALEALARVNGRPRRLHVRTWSDVRNGNGVVVHCAIQDNGPGFPPEAAKNIFDYGYSTKLDRREGSGIGLHFCRQALAQINGSIEARSAADQGAAFVVSLPGDAVDAEAMKD